MELNNEFLKRVGMEVKVARIRKGYSVPQLAKQTGLSKQALHQLENGKNDFKILTLKRVANALEVQVTDFFVILPNDKG